jgi:hypothetical protein
MDISKALDGLWDSLDQYRSSEEDAFLDWCREKLKLQEQYAAKDVDELRELALLDADLVEPEDA